MPSLIPFLLAEPALPVAVRASLRTYAHAPDPQVRARARHVAATSCKWGDRAEGHAGATESKCRKRGHAADFASVFRLPLDTMAASR